MLRTTVIGSWPLPNRYADALQRYHRGEMSLREAEPILSAATRTAVREQKATGVAEVMGGNLFADAFLSHLPRCLTGIQAVEPGGREAGSAAGGRRFFRLVGPLEAPRGIGVAEAFRRESALEVQLSKVSCPGPMTVLSFLLLADPSAFSALPNAVAIVRREVEELARAGAREIQLDAVAEVSALQLFNHDPREVATAIGGAFQGLRNVSRTVHFCFGGLKGSSLSPEEHLRKVLPVIERLVGRVDRVHIECVEAGIRRMLHRIPAKMEVIAGIAAAEGGVEPVDVLVCRVREVLPYVPAERLWLAPVCGLRGCTAEQAVGILTNLVAAARRFPA